MYVDDTSLCVSGTSLPDINSKLQVGLNNLCTWASDNRMVLHPKKTKVMLIGTKQRLAKSEPLRISINSDPIEQSTCEKLLGIHIDSSLTWNEQVSKTIKKFNSKLELIRRAKPF